LPHPWKRANLLLLLASHRFDDYPFHLPAHQGLPRQRGGHRAAPRFAVSGEGAERFICRSYRLAERIEAAIEVLNDIHYSQLFHHDEDATTRDVVQRGLIHVIQSDVARLREEFAARVNREAEGTGAALGEARRPTALWLNGSAPQN
jgi:hypothetical protein